MASSSTSPQVYGQCADPIKRLLLQWHQELADATDRMRPYNDLPYWYNERANVGFVAQAASKLGFAVLEEYTVDRGKDIKVRSGRADLWIGDTSKDEYEFEFKLHWASIKSNETKLAEKIEGCLVNAKEQLLDIKDKHDRHPCKVAMVFVAPWIAKRDTSRWKELLRPFWDWVTQPNAFGSEFSTVFVPPDDVQGTNRVATGSYLYPAIAIFGRVVRP